MYDYISNYFEYLTKVKNSSKNTIDSYMRDIKGFIKYSEEIQLNMSTASKEDIEAYLKVLSKKGKTSATIIRTLASIRSFYQFLIYENEVKVNPTKQIKTKSTEKKLPQVLSQKEVDLLLNQPDVMTQRGMRDKAMLELMYATGIRVSELINLNVEDFNPQINILHCRTSKGDRVIPVYKQAVHSIEDYLSKVRSVIVTDVSEPALFLNLNGERLTRQGFWKIIKGYALSAGIDKDITPHTIRHSFATHLLENGAQVNDIKEMLGHSGTAAANVYARIISSKYENSYNKFHPKAGILK